MTLEDALLTMRRDGWVVAIHNDFYTGTGQIGQCGRLHTFWMFTRRTSGTGGGRGEFVKGEGRRDIEAVEICMRQAKLTDV